MGLITPDYGLLFWMLLSFSILLYILKKFAWKPILGGIKNREELVSRALHSAELARNEVAQLEERNAKLIEKVQLERDAIIQEARKQKERILEEATLKAQQEAQKYLEQAREAIKREKEIAQLELKAYASDLVVKATERILRKELEDKKNYETQINNIIEELTTKN